MELTAIFNISWLNEQWADLSSQVITSHLHWSYAFSVNPALFINAPDYDSVPVTSCQWCSFLWPSEVHSLGFVTVSKRRWLIRDSRWEAGKPVTAGNDTSLTVSHFCLFEVFAEHSSVWFPDKWKDLFKDALGFVQVLQTADCSTLKSFVCNVRLDNPVSYRMGGCSIHTLISSAC